MDISIQRSTLLLILYFVTSGSCQDQEENNSTGYNFQTYEIFKVESTFAGDNAACECSVDASVLGHEWNEWSRCQGHQKSFQCHRGIQYRWRPCSSTSERKQCKQREWKYCYNERSCTGQWLSWTNAADGGVCSHTCGGGVRLKVRACVKNNEIGLFCAGNNRSPYDIKKELCNSQKCPAWSDWRVKESNCTDDKSSVDGPKGITYVRKCIYDGKITDGCAGGVSEDWTTRRCDDTPLSFPVGASKTGQVTVVPDNTTTTYVLVAIIGVLIVVVFIFCGRLCSTTHRKLMQDRKTTISPTTDVSTEKSNSFVASKLLGSHPRSRLSRKPKWKTPENYEEIVLDGEPIHGSFTARVAGLTAPSLALPAIPPPLRGSFQDLSHQVEHKGLETYTIMAGSPTSTAPNYGRRALPDRAKSRRQSTPPLPKRNFTDDSLRPVPVDIAFDGSSPSENKTEQRNSIFSVPVNDVEAGHVYLESRSLTRPGKEKKKKEKNVKRRKSEDYGARKTQKSRRENDSTVSRENSVGFSRLHSSTKEDNAHSSLSHLYAEIHDNTRF